MASARYASLPQDNESKESLLFNSNFQRSKRSHTSKKIIFSLCILLAVSLSFNGVVIYQKLEKEIANIYSSPYAGLVRDFPIPWTNYDRVFADQNRTIADAAWSAYNTDMGVVALSDEFVLSTGLPPAQRWPLDHSKSIYYINAFHSIHCLQTLREVVYRAFDNMPQIDSLGHALHCIDALREEVVCNIDDTPRYTGLLNANAKTARPMAGLDQHRMCYDWSKLEDFVIANSACWKNINESVVDFPVIERYKFCPNGKTV